MKRNHVIIWFILLSLVSFSCADSAVDELIEKGKQFESAGKYDQALQCYDEAISLEPDESYVYLPKYSLLWKIGYYEDARELWEVVMQKLPNSSEPIYYYSFMPGGSRMCAEYFSTGIDYMIQKGDYNKALFYFGRVEELCPNDTDIGNLYADKGYAYYKLGRLNESIVSYTLAVQIAEEKLKAQPERSDYKRNYEIYRNNLQIVSRKMSGAAQSNQVAPPVTPVLETTVQPTGSTTQPTPESSRTKETPLPSVYPLLAVPSALFLRKVRGNGGAEHQGEILSSRHR